MMYHKLKINKKMFKKIQIKIYRYYMIKTHNF